MDLKHLSRVSDSKSKVMDDIYSDASKYWDTLSRGDKKEIISKVYPKSRAAELSNLNFEELCNEDKDRARFLLRAVTTHRVGDSKKLEDTKEMDDFVDFLDLVEKWKDKGHFCDVDHDGDLLIFSEDLDTEEFHIDDFREYAKKLGYEEVDNDNHHDTDYYYFKKSISDSIGKKSSKVKDDTILQEVSKYWDGYDEEKRKRVLSRLTRKSNVEKLFNKDFKEIYSADERLGSHLIDEIYTIEDSVKKSLRRKGDSAEDMPFITKSYDPAKYGDKEYTEALRLGNKWLNDVVRPKLESLKKVYRVESLDAELSDVDFLSVFGELGEYDFNKAKSLYSDVETFFEGLGFRRSNDFEMDINDGDGHIQIGYTVPVSIKVKDSIDMTDEEIKQWAEDEDDDMEFYEEAVKIRDFLKIPLSVAMSFVYGDDWDHYSAKDVKDLEDRLRKEYSEVFDKTTDWSGREPVEKLLFLIDQKNGSVDVGVADYIDSFVKGKPCNAEVRGKTIIFSEPSDGDLREEFEKEILSKGYTNFAQDEDEDVKYYFYRKEEVKDSKRKIKVVARKQSDSYESMKRDYVNVETAMEIVDKFSKDHDVTNVEKHEKNAEFEVNTDGGVMSVRIRPNYSTMFIVELSAKEFKGFSQDTIFAKDYSSKEDCVDAVLKKIEDRIKFLASYKPVSDSKDDMYELCGHIWNAKSKAKKEALLPLRVKEFAELDSDEFKSKDPLLWKAVMQGIWMQENDLYGKYEVTEEMKKKYIKDDSGEQQYDQGVQSGNLAKEKGWTYGQTIRYYQELHQQFYKGLEKAYFGESVD